MIIAVDFDGTLCLGQSPNTNRDEIPNLPLIQKCKEAKQKGHKLILWTCRGGSWLEEAIDFCEYFGLEFDATNENISGIDYTRISCKAIADLYVDDKAPGSIQYFMDMKL
ncbi:hypothetical protein LCGC14_1583880 [marine sediment metagenome]|uniref:Hydrolase n=1 Tax=marine sediment metagenome TaxID=412755 RepID=A0A0F9J287_9ZZZZ